MVDVVTPRKTRLSQCAKIKSAVLSSMEKPWEAIVRSRACSILDGGSSYNCILCGQASINASPKRKQKLPITLPQPGVTVQGTRLVSPKRMDKCKAFATQAHLKRDGEVRDVVVYNERDNSNNNNNPMNQTTGAIIAYISPSSSSVEPFDPSQHYVAVYDKRGRPIQGKKLRDPYYKEERDDNAEIDAFMRRFAELRARGHFPNADLDGIRVPRVLDQDGGVLGGAIEVDVDYGFVKKEYNCDDDQYDPTLATLTPSII
eukprot:CAMPEP_0172519070 /NCGR_PEP_ID=MMETSP1066-20121228/291197_1 /TAXON_ID=671091 /ORGANISM="Coscinodiscus wailesii, Strain CCMP2513" /LENGTH=258 /DNA_ID=CAMNT_0013301581 /DNA_START=759 /DNA_END=1535 /DNA_ORIENTATION=-